MNEVEEQFEIWFDAEVEEDADVDRDMLLKAFIAGKTAAEENFHYDQ